MVKDFDKNSSLLEDPFLNVFLDLKPHAFIISELFSFYSHWIPATYLYKTFFLCLLIFILGAQKFRYDRITHNLQVAECIFLLSRIIGFSRGSSLRILNLEVDQLRFKKNLVLTSIKDHLKLNFEFFLGKKKSLCDYPPSVIFE